MVAKSTIFKQKTHEATIVAVAINSHYLAMIVNVHRKGRAGNQGTSNEMKTPLVIEKSVRVTVRKRLCHIVIEIEPYNLANVVDGVGTGGGSFRERYIERQEQASIPKPMKPSHCCLDNRQRPDPSSLIPIASVRMASGKSSRVYLPSCYEKAM